MKKYVILQDLFRFDIDFTQLSIDNHLTTVWQYLETLQR